MLMTAKALLDRNPDPAKEDVVSAFTKNRNLCRCTGYVSIVRAVLKAAEMIRGGKGDAEPSTVETIEAAGKRITELLIRFIHIRQKKAEPL
jgi:xanthine dehydrogenase iron-sulfur cluster and FAD-binding subunit A